MKLVLAEKPSVAQSIAKVLGAAKREDGYLEGNGYVVSWCVGHLVELAQPEVYDAKYSKWAYADLPIFPMDWQYEVSAGTKKQFGILKKLMAREDVASLVCATDAGREGELIFRLVYHKAGCRKPFERLWISSMEDVAIKEGFENLRSGTEYDALYEAALCRERADWIVGINATRLFSTLYGQTLNVGRVMTPTLAMAVMREAAISAFKRRKAHIQHQCCVVAFFDALGFARPKVLGNIRRNCIADGHKNQRKDILHPHRRRISCKSLCAERIYHRLYDHHTDRHGRLLENRWNSNLKHRVQLPPVKPGKCTLIPPHPIEENQ